MNEIDTTNSIIYDLGVSASSCGYCGGEGCIVHAMRAERLTPRDYQELLDRGFRRSGKLLYRPEKGTCCPLWTVRMDATTFQPTKAQRKIVRRVQTFCRKPQQPAERQYNMPDDPDRSTDHNQGGSSNPLQGCSTFNPLVPNHLIEQGSDGIRQTVCQRPEQTHPRTARLSTVETSPGQISSMRALTSAITTAVEAIVASGQLPVQNKDYEIKPVKALMGRQARALPTCMKYTSPAAIVIAGQVSQAASSHMGEITATALSDTLAQQLRRNGLRSAGWEVLPLNGHLNFWEITHAPTSTAGSCSQVCGAGMTTAAASDTAVCQGQVAQLARSEDDTSALINEGRPGAARDGRPRTNLLPSPWNRTSPRQETAAQPSHSAALEQALDSIPTAALEQVAAPALTHIAAAAPYQFPSTATRSCAPSDDCGQLLPRNADDAADDVAVTRQHLHSQRSTQYRGCSGDSVTNGGSFLHAAGDPSSSDSAFVGTSSQIGVGRTTVRLSDRGVGEPRSNGQAGVSCAAATHHDSNSTAGPHSPSDKRSTVTAADQGLNCGKLHGELGKAGEECVGATSLNPALPRNPTPDTQNQQLRIKMLPSNSEAVAEEYELYRAYQSDQHGDSPAQVTRNQFYRFLVESPLPPPQSPPASEGCCDSEAASDDVIASAVYGSYHVQYWLGSHLAAVSVVDILPHCISSVYCFWSKRYAKLSLGKFTVMQEAKWARIASMQRPALKYLYLGYWVCDNQKMAYKVEFGPSEILCPNSLCWAPFEQARHIIRPREYCDLSAVAGSLQGLGNRHRMLSTGRSEPPHLKVDHAAVTASLDALLGGEGVSPSQLAILWHLQEHFLSSVEESDGGRRPVAHV